MSHFDVIEMIDVFIELIMQTLVLMWRDDQASIWIFYVQNIPKSSVKNVNKYNTQFNLIKLSRNFLEKFKI